MDLRKPAMRSDVRRMDPKDLEKYDPNGEADTGLRTAAKVADERLARATNKLIHGTF